MILQGPTGDGLKELFGSPAPAERAAEKHGQLVVSSAALAAAAAASADLSDIERQVQDKMERHRLRRMHKEMQREE